MASTYLTRTNASAATNVDKATISFWLKRTRLGTEESVFGAYSSDANRLKFRFRSDNKFDFEVGVGGSWYSLITNRRFIDTNSWYHFVISYDSTQATASDRTKIYINGVLETSYATSNYVPQNQDFYFTKNGLGITIGDNYQGGSHQNYFDGLLSHFVCVDGQALDATTFGQTDSDTGEWKWKGVSGVTYGNNGFYLLKDVANVTDYSGNNNNFTAGGGGMTLTQDNPSNNFPTMKSPGWSDHAHSYGGNRVVTSGTNYRYSVATMGVHKGKWYWEAKFQAVSDYAIMGISGDTGGQSNSTGHILGAGLYHYSVVYNTVGGNGHKYNNAGNSPTNTPGAFMGGFSAGDILTFALDCDNNTLKIGANGQWANGSGSTNQTFANTTAITIADPTLVPSGYYFPACGDYTGTSSTIEFNFGNGFFGNTAITSAGTNASNLGLFEYDVPADYKAICSKGLNT